MFQFSKIIYQLLIVTFFERFSHFLIIPFLSIYLIQEFSYSSLEIGIILSSSGCTALIISFILAPMLSTVNKKKIILCSIFTAFISFVIFPYIHSYYGFLFFTIINTIASSLLSPTYKTLLTLYSETSRKQLVFNIRYYLINIAAALGPFISIQIQEVSSLKNVCIFISFIYFINFIFFLFSSIEEKRSENPKLNYLTSFGIIKRNKAYVLLLLGSIFFVFGYSQILSSIPQFFAIKSHSKATSIYGYLLSINGVIALTCQYFIYLLNKRYSHKSCIILGAITLTLGLFTFGLTENIVLLAFAMIVFTMGEMLVFTTIDIRIDEITDKYNKGAYYSLLGLQNIGSLLAPVIGGLIITQFKSGMLIFSILSLITSFSILLFYKSNKIKI
ncbi:TPA: MFS transporter [Staphylococcus aureus]|nr:MFS transporter [Staphylococcus aureus]HDH4260733.1 MFS transporter [Staphylococcus aureus]HDH4923595.1 MFS transporter [Staphylococcus aureus]HDH4923847.1 MFS transporter [Staphylococcus aureus]HEI8037258.1 MFS transporter [Staphylococcus aureus]